MEHLSQSHNYTLITFVQCVPLPGLGFRRGSYKCLCRKGYYFPDTKAERRYYNGTVIEEEYEKLMLVSNIFIFY